MTIPIDVLVVTALKSEYDAARQVFTKTDKRTSGVGQWKKVRGDRPYIFGRYELTDQTSFVLALARSTRMGANATGSLAATLLDRLRPACLAMSGVCAGNPDEVALGDVVIGELAYAYDEGKRDADGFLGDHRQSPISEEWLRQAQDLEVGGLASFGPPTDEDAKYWLLERLYKGADPTKHPARTRYFREGEWKTTVQQLENDGLIDRTGKEFRLLAAGQEFIEASLVYDIDPPAHLPFAIKVGPIASGNVVVKDGVTWDSLKRMGVRTVVGLEMEAAAIGIAARAAGVRQWIVVKGVMDHADPNKDDRFKSFGSRASAEVLAHFLEQQAETFSRRSTNEGEESAIAADWYPRSPKDPEFLKVSTLLAANAPEFRRLFDRALEAAIAAADAALEAHRIADAISQEAGHKILRAKAKPFVEEKLKILKLKKLTGNKGDGAKVWDSGDEYIGQMKGSTEQGHGVYRVFSISAELTPTLASSYAGKVQSGYGPSGVYTFPDRAQFMGQWSGQHPSFGYREFVGAQNSVKGDLYLGAMASEGGGYSPRWFPHGEGIVIDASARTVTCGVFANGHLKTAARTVSY
ncbi:hypothetical protein GOL40_28055 [Sinorhizobium medicae]|nr:hypothetical protein [Sinorhizobium medicae]